MDCEIKVPRGDIFKILVAREAGALFFFFLIFGELHCLFGWCETLSSQRYGGKGVFCRYPISKAMVDWLVYSLFVGSLI